MAKDNYETAWAAEVATAAKLAKLQSESREKLKKELAASLEQNVDKARESIVDHFVQGMSKTVTRQRDAFVDVERHIVLQLANLFTGKYEGRIDSIWEEYQQVLHALRAVSDRVALESERFSIGKVGEILVDALLVILAMIVPFYYSFITVDGSPVFQYVIPTFYFLFVVALVSAKVYLFIRRAFQSKKLQEFVDAKLASVEPRQDTTSIAVVSEPS